MPWAQRGRAGKALPLIQFALTFAEELSKEPDPNKQGYTACTLAYCRAVEQAFLAESRQLLRSRPGKRVQRMVLEPMSEEISMERFSWDSALESEFVQEADRRFEAFAREGLGIERRTINKLLGNVRRQFRSNLRQILSHGDTREEFAAFSQLLNYQLDEDKDEAAIAQHLDYQWWLFNQAPVFRQEPFPLAAIYVDELECGVLKWGEIQPKRRTGRSYTHSQDEDRIDPFSEQDSPRQNLLETVLKYFNDRNFDEPIVIQGIAGAGKSSFTLRLANELIERGFKPIRILLKHLDVEDNLHDAIPNALSRNLSGEGFEFGYDPPISFGWLKTVLDSNATLKLEEGGLEICPYVFIFDGWDELSTGASQEFRKDVDRVLTEIRQLFFERRRGPRIRVVITGRPSVDVTKTRMLKQETPILTIRPFTPEQLKQYIEQMLFALQQQPLPLSGIEIAGADKDIAWFDKVTARYQQEFEIAQQKKEQTPSKQEPGDVSVLGLPLLSYLAMRLMRQLDTLEALDEILDNPTTLYRALVDMTYEKAGKASTINRNSGDFAHQIEGWTLRKLLWQTAWAIAATGGESISREELRLRLDLEDEDLAELTAEIEEEHVLSRLIVSYFFKEGTGGQGCEFLHKSFREYLFAEGIVEILKQYGTDPRVAKAYEQNPQGLAEREPIWKDFAEDDPRHELTRKLASVISPSGLSPEIKGHIYRLLKWEITRAGEEVSQLWPGTPTTQLTRFEWEYIRDGLADVWDWWAEGVFLSPQPVANKRKTPEFNSAYVNELVEWCSPQDSANWKTELPPPVRLTVVDSRIGDAFFFLAAVLHARLTKPIGAATEVEWSFRRRYQQEAMIGDSSVVRFSPSGKDGQHFKTFCARINAGGWRQEGDFPSKVFAAFSRLSDVNLFGTDLREAHLWRAELSGADLRGVHLSGADLSESYLIRANLKGANLNRAHLVRADLSEAHLVRADLSEAHLIKACLRKTHLIKAYLIRADFRGAHLRGADFRGAYLKSAHLTGADLTGADLTGADLRRSDLRRANLTGADLRGADLRGADLAGADLAGADLRGADLAGADLAGADLAGADLAGADLAGADLRGAKYSEATTLPQGLDPEECEMILVSGD